VRVVLAALTPLAPVLFIGAFFLYRFSRLVTLGAQEASFFGLLRLYSSLAIIIAPNHSGEELGQTCLDLDWIHVYLPQFTCVGVE
jgi:hypothetical protein